MATFGSVWFQNNAWLNVPWGVAIAGANFGSFSYSLLVGNFGDGTISAFDPVTGDYIGTMQDGKGNPLSIDGLWGLLFGNGGNGGDPTALNFFAAPSGVAHGLLGSLKPAADSLERRCCGLRVWAVGFVQSGDGFDDAVG